MSATIDGLWMAQQHQSLLKNIMYGKQNWMIKSKIKSEKIVHVKCMYDSFNESSWCEFSMDYDIAFFTLQLSSSLLLFLLSTQWPGSFIITCNGGVYCSLHGALRGTVHRAGQLAQQSASWVHVSIHLLLPFLLQWED